MAHTRQAEKRIRQNQRRALVNGARRNRVRTHVRSVEEAIARGDRAAALVALRAAEPELMRGAQKGAIEKRAASRKVSRLSLRIQAMAL